MGKTNSTDNYSEYGDNQEQGQMNPNFLGATTSNRWSFS